MRFAREIDSRVRVPGPTEIVQKAQLAVRGAPRQPTGVSVDGFAGRSKRMAARREVRREVKAAGAMAATSVARTATRRERPEATE